MKPLLLGEAPGRGAKRPFRPLDGPTGALLAKCARMPLPKLLESFETRNLLGRYPGANGKGTAWDREAAARAAIRKPLKGTAILLGSRVWYAYAYSRNRWLQGADWGEWRVGPRGQYVAVIPHPSGINQLYNSEQMRELVGDVLRSALE